MLIKILENKNGRPMVAPKFCLFVFVFRGEHLSPAVILYYFCNVPLVRPLRYAVINPSRSPSITA